MHIWKKHELNMQLNMISFHIGFRVGPMAQATLVYLWRKVVCFVLLSLWDLPNWGISNCILHVFGQLSTRRGALSWFHDVWTCGAEVLEYWMIYSLKIKLNHKWKFQKNWDVPLVLLERSWWAGFNGISFVRFGLRMPEILNFKWFLLLKIQINHTKKVLEGKIRWECGHTWKITIQFKYGNWDVPLVLLKRSWWMGFSGINFVSFGLRMQEILNF